MNRDNVEEDREPEFGPKSGGELEDLSADDGDLSDGLDNSVDPSEEEEDY